MTPFMAEYVAQLRGVRELKNRTLIGEVGRTCLRGVIILLLLAVSIATLPGCTLVQYKSTDRSITVIDLHPTQNAISLSGILDGTGSIDVNREQGGAEGIVDSAAELLP